MDKTKERHSRTALALSGSEMEKIAGSRVLVAGCGGLGGYIIEYLARLGIGAITVVDGDVFEESNLNRQLLGTTRNIGQSKAAAAKDRIGLIDPSIRVKAVSERLTKENAPVLLADADIIIDALDNIDDRLMLEDAAALSGIAIVHGAIHGWDLQVMVVPPGSGLLHSIYQPDSRYEDADANTDKASLSFTPAACAAMQTAAAVRYLCGHETHLEGNILTASLSDMSFNMISLI